MVTERQVLKGGDGGGGDAARCTGVTLCGAMTPAEAASHATEWQNHRLPQVQAPSSSASVPATVEEVVVSPVRLSDTVTPQKPPQHYTAASTADSKVLFAEDEDEEGEDEGRQPWRPNHLCAASGDPQRSARAEEVEHVLGELSECSSITSARPQAPRRSPDTRSGRDDRVLHHGCAPTDSNKEVQGGPLDVSYTDTTVARGAKAVLGGEDGEKARRQTCVACTTPSLKPACPGLSEGSVTPVLEGQVWGAASAAATFTETLAVQDLSLLPDESGGGATLDVGGVAKGDGCVYAPLLSSSTGQRTPYSAIANAGASARLRGDKLGVTAAEEVLLGEGLISPPVKRTTAIPQQATHAVEVAAEDGTETRSRAGETGAGPSRVHGKILAMGDSSSSTTFLSTPSSATLCAVTGGGEASGFGQNMNTPTSPSSADGAVLMTEEQPPPPPRVSLTPSSPSPPPNSLPSTLDDGLWKGSARSAQADVVDTDAVAPGRCTPKRQGVSDDAPAPLAPSVAVAQHQTVPIDPFLSTPPQFKGESPAIEKDDSGGGVRVRRSPERSGREDAGKGGHSPAVFGFPTRTPPRSAKKSAMAFTSTITGADVDVQALRVGTRVEGRWGRQWFPAVISEAPRNGFVQVEWEEDGSRLHLRLREVRLLPGAAAAKRAGAVPAIHEADRCAASVGGGAAATEGAHDVLTATQLVALMEEEDAEDSRHQPVPPHVRPSASQREMSPPMTTSVCKQVNRSGGEGGEGAEEDVVVRPLGVGHACGTAGRGVYAVNADGDAHPDRASSAASSAGVANTRSPSRSPVPTYAAPGVPPCEVHPSFLCIFLPQTVRRDLLQGEGPPPASAFSSSSSFHYHAGPATELQRRTELQRILHFLTSAGTVVIDSVAQADNMAAQLGDSGDGKGTAFTSHLSSLAAGQHHSADSSPMQGAKTTKAVAGGGRKRGTVGRASLPRRSMASAVAVASHAQRSAPRYFVFLVSSATALMGGSAEASEKLGQQQDVLPVVCLAHALGVSAIHASWLWGIAPGTARVKLPTPADQVELLPSAAPETWGAWKATRAGAPSTKAAPLPLRFAPFAVKDRWLSAKDVAFVARDDRMEMWLNAAGATVTAESAPSLPSHVARQSLPRGSSRPSASVTGALVGRSLGSALPRCHSESPSRSLPLKQLRAERTPDFVYVPDDVTVPLDLDRLGSVPVLQVSWLADGIEQHYRHCCDPTSSAEPVLPTPPSLTSVWRTILHAKPPKESYTRRSNTPSQPGCAQSSPSSPPLRPAVSDEEKRCGSEGARSRKAAAATTLGSERDRLSHHGSDAVHPESVPPLANNRDESGDDAGPSAFPPSAKGGNMDEGVGDTVGAIGGRLNEEEEEALTMRIGGGDAHEPLPREADDFASASGPDGAAAERCSAEAGKDIMSRLAGATGATAAALSDAVGSTESSACTSHAAIVIGEDYYFTLSAPQPPPPPSLSPHGLSLPHVPPPALPTATIVLGQVVGLQVDAPPSPLLRQHLCVDGTASSLTFSQPQCRCRVTLRLYEPKYISMHVDPRSGDVVHQTTVYLAQRWATVPGTSLLFDTPVYVITTAARPHVYFLEEVESEVTAQGVSDSAYHSRLRQQSVLGAVATPPVSDLFHGAAREPDGTLSPHFHGRRSLSQVAMSSSAPVPTCPITRGCLPTPPAPFSLTQSIANGRPRRDALAPSRTSEGAARDGSGDGVDERRGPD
ncbi:conserved hypothetical protein [Leishmania major strain Friedlin]|uniref:Uncharacterized protein n=1 Tax=Leishmania major TaxID=5664 RepID=Q4Q7H2_LEIMA|nr:conserved hypothetical protein [Leishmania major strain Friedlin]CAG9578328.1 hypothetical_protein_-_conserved [Leishmania major strain Friedlin]CAJ06201.1 conserved hypothetical protein [Leishmania major strain Friedlin]|eukprot:XP_001684726.1 conserved hypothetical protein [Leishmania major strain Friedlin]